MPHRSVQRMSQTQRRRDGESARSSWTPAMRVGRGPADLREPRLRFVMSAGLRYGNGFDVDNVAEPVPARRWRRPPHLRSVWVTIEIGSAPGVEVSEVLVPTRRQTSSWFT